MRPSVSLLAPVLASAVALVALGACSSSKKSGDSATTTTSVTRASSSTSSTRSTVTTGAPTTSTTSSSVTTSGTGTTIARPTVTITGFSSSPASPVPCNAPTEIQLSWTVTGTQKVQLSIDGKVAANYGGGAKSPLQFFSCDGKPHTYLLTAGSGANSATARLVVTSTRPTA